MSKSATPRPPTPTPAELNQLTPGERGIAIVLALSGVGLTKSQLLPGLSALGARTPQGRAYTSVNLPDALDAMAERGFLTYDVYARLAPGLAWPLLLATPRPMLEVLLTALRKATPLTPGRKHGLAHELMWALYCRDADALETLLDWSRKNDPLHDLNRWFPRVSELLLEHLRPAPRAFAFAAAELLRERRLALLPTKAPGASPGSELPEKDLIDELAALALAHPLPPHTTHELARHLLLAGRDDEAEAVLSRRDPRADAAPLTRSGPPRGRAPTRRTATEDHEEIIHALLAWLALLRGDAVAARDSLPRAIPSAWADRSAAGPELVVAALLRLTSGATSVSSESSPKVFRDALSACGPVLAALAEVAREGEPSEARSQDHLRFSLQYGGRPDTPEQWAWVALCESLLRSLAPNMPRLFDNERQGVAHWAKAARSAGQTWLADELEATGLEAARPGARPRTPTALRSLLVAPRPWEKKLERLEKAVGVSEPRAAPKKAKALDTEPDTRLVWWVEDEGGHLRVHPREQKRDPKGQWTKGKRVALERLFGRRPAFAPLTEADRAVCACIEEVVTVSRGYRDVSYVLDLGAAFRALAAHPHVYWADKVSAPLVLSFREPRLKVTRSGPHLHLRLEPEIAHAGQLVLKTSPFELTLYTATELHAALGQVLGAGLELPASERARVQRILDAVMGRVAVDSELGGGGSTVIL
jgi:hypothetical protein